MCCLFWPALISLADEGIHNTSATGLDVGRTAAIFALYFRVEYVHNISIFQYNYSD
jgi:hypothetical protein